jgi:nucleotide-binding universal stress UspA family protein
LEAIMYRRILVPTDGSAVAEQAAVAAIEFAQACGSEIVALSVAQPYPMPSVDAAMVVDPADSADLLVASARAHVQHVADLAKAAGVPCTTAVEYSFSPSARILDAVKTNGCDLVFMGSHGRHGLSRLLAGSETQHVLAAATVPVMVFHPQVHGAAAQGAFAAHAGAAGGLAEHRPG